jgi:O-antigen ligase
LALVAVPLFPLAGLYAFVALEYGPDRYDPDFFSFLTQAPVIEAFGILLLLGWLLARSTRPRPAVLFTTPSILVLSFFSWLALSEAVSLLGGSDWNPIPGRHNPLLYPIGLLLFLIAATELSNLRSSILLALFSCAVITARGFLKGHSYLDGDIATLSVILMPIALLGLMNTRDRFLQSAFVGMLIYLGWMLLSSNNRAAAIAFVAMTLTLVWQGRHKLIAVGLAAPVVLGAAIIMAPTAYIDRFVAIWDTGASHETAKLDRATVKSRITHWQSAWRMVQDRPMFGVGLGNYPVARGAYSDLSWNSREVVHNNYVGIAAESGIIGLALYATAFLTGLMVCSRTMKRENYTWLNPNCGMIRASLAAYLVTGAFLSRPDMGLAYLLLGWAFAASTKVRGAGQRSSPIRVTTKEQKRL